MTNHKHFRPAGKKEGNAAKYMTRSKAIRYLQTNLANFRKLCILKGICPRVPKKKFEGSNKTYYYMKDILFILHEPLLEKFRIRRAYDKKVKKALAKKNSVAVDRLISRKPTYKLDKIVLERYPRFVDALRDLDDCLTRVHLFASLSASTNESIGVEQIYKCQRLSLEWQAYILQTHSLRSTFVSVKGIYYEAEVQGQTILWLTPHAAQQVFPQDVDFKTLINFLEFDMALLTFVNYKLYHSIQVTYPPSVDPHLEALATDVNAVSRRDLSTMSSTLASKQLHSFCNADTIKCQNLDSDLDCKAKEYRFLFKDLKFFLNREVPRQSLLFVIPAFGGMVSWEGEGAPFKESDGGVTHQIADKPTQGHIFLSREYIQPQWVYDCIQSMTILPTSDYAIGRRPPYHLSPFVNNKAEKVKRPPGAAGDDTQEIAEDDENMSKAAMTRERRKLFEAIQISRKREEAHSNLLKERLKANAAKSVGF